ncbi:hypothetical protein K2Z83_26715 [Oscillochloris sp. ZM17-4]|uniref:hypothetical protein n=1 Tax=Oscillochloris sp. ZM17-4 TaxID=2866714 RepID=UPI001C72A293|nr:hypothetical protein [Oscillochloris sp. ZM17-4]MBX0331246.1 hypothetical protein [Oscillochloris sp. ZM17-4]
MRTFPTSGRAPQGRQRGPATTDIDRAAVRPAPYLRVPDRLLRAFAHDPLAVGVYLGVARCAIAYQAAAPLSPADLAAWGSGERTRDLALMRRIRRLTDDGWLVAEPGRAVKLRLLPTWGDESTPWQLDDGQLGKPDGLRTRRVPLDLLDTYLGRIDPQSGRTPALITRYFDRPLIGLVDIGVYAISQITTITPTKALLALGLLGEDGPQPPQPLADLLATTADGQLPIGDATGDSTIRLSIQGRYRLGARNGSPNGSCSGSLNGSLNGSCTTTPDEERSTASEREETPDENSAAAAAWDGWDRSTEGHESPTPNREDSTRAGGRVIRLPVESFRRTAIDPEHAQLLTAMGIRQQHTLAHVPLDLIQAWQNAIAHPGMAARFDDPVALAAAQLRREIGPPSERELERWARGSAPRDDGRHYAPVVAFDEVRHAALLAQARGIAGECDDLLIGFVVAALDAGMDEISALIHAQREVDRAARQDPESSEEVYRALRARATR